MVGTDEAFFDDEGDQTDLPLFNLYNETSGILDGDDETDVDLASYAYQIWKNAIDRDPALKNVIETMPNVVLLGPAAPADGRSTRGGTRLSADRRRERCLGLGEPRGSVASPSRNSRFSRRPNAPRTPLPFPATSGIMKWSPTE